MKNVKSEKKIIKIKHSRSLECHPQKGQKVPLQNGLIEDPVKCILKFAFPLIISRARSLFMLQSICVIRKYRHCLK